MFNKIKDVYGLSPNSVKLLQNYLTGRKQQIKLQGVLSSWANIQKEELQGSILGLLLFKFQLNLNRSINTELSFSSISIKFS
jgi:hypothetical protein